MNAIHKAQLRTILDANAPYKVVEEMANIKFSQAETSKMHWEKDTLTLGFQILSKFAYRLKDEWVREFGE